MSLNQALLDTDELRRIPLVASVIADETRDQVALLIMTAPGLLPRAEIWIDVTDIMFGAPLSFPERKALADNIAQRLNRVADRLTPGVR